MRVRLAVGADGQHSLCRAAAGIATTRRTYPQTALTLNLAHTRSHDNTSTEFHTESGPFTLVPLPGRRSSLVCVLDPARAAELFANRLRAFQAARITGRFVIAPTTDAAAERQAALAEYDRIECEITSLGSQAEQETQINRRAEMNLEIRRLRNELAQLKTRL